MKFTQIFNFTTVSWAGIKITSSPAKISQQANSGFIHYDLHQLYLAHNNQNNYCNEWYYLSLRQQLYQTYTCHLLARVATLTLNSQLILEGLSHHTSVSHPSRTAHLQLVPIQSHHAAGAITILPSSFARLPFNENCTTFSNCNYFLE